jgi:hypothetical protein
MRLRASFLTNPTLRPFSPGTREITALINLLRNVYPFLIAKGVLWNQAKFCGCTPHSGNPAVRLQRSVEGSHSMEITNPGALWLVPVFLSVAFLLWVLWNFWRDEHR